MPVEIPGAKQCRSEPRVIGAVRELDRLQAEPSVGEMGPSVEARRVGRKICSIIKYQAWLGGVNLHCQFPLGGLQSRRQRQPILGAI